MYRKSVNAGSQSDISRKDSSQGEMTAEPGVNVVTNASKTNNDLETHKDTHHAEKHQANGRTDRSQVRHTGGIEFGSCIPLLDTACREGVPGLLGQVILQPRHLRHQPRGEV